MLDTQYDNLENAIMVQLQTVPKTETLFKIMVPKTVPTRFFDGLLYDIQHQANLGENIFLRKWDIFKCHAVLHFTRNIYHIFPKNCLNDALN